MRLVLLLCVLFFVTLGCSQIKSKDITEVSQKELDTIVLVDVRTPKEFNAGHMDNALNINWYDDDFAGQFEDISKDRTIYLYCRSGKRSADATQFLDSLGYAHVVNLRGGYIAWKDKK